VFFSVKKSWEKYEESLNYLAGGSSTNSKAPRFKNEEPALIVRGKGCRIWDVDGNEYIDFRNSWERIQNWLLIAHSDPI